ncbi:putative membrane protein DUF2142 [Glaciihabitans tibetensis]|uniref:Putative membrane protein DUF2142 n=1 Tax=Glaciihabitans tibetensis TaxID=1266600 RepID=A0A2T0VFC8_9MICO|nr:DUF2142 domain-containing protein [Glaciihabitans tibetensis]PRY68909.1 putative membrane protein DUF2142 [Glaciihabitans tibetensis]
MRAVQGSSSDRALRRSGSIFWAALIFFSLLSTLWALAGPVFSVPDENAHATKAIAQLRGQVIGNEVLGIRHIVVELPEGYEYNPSILCFAFHSETPANCGVELGDEGTTWFNTWVGAYNPVYYYLVGWPSLIFDGNASVYAMRIASALVGSIFLALAAQAALAATRARWMPVALLFLASPMIVYFTGAVNPQGLEVAAAAALWVALLRLLETWRRPDEVLLSRTYLWAVVAVSATLVANVRALGPLWVVVIILSCLIISGWQSVKGIFSTVRSYWGIGAVAVAGLFSVIWTLSGGSLSKQALPTDAPLVGASFFSGFMLMMRRTPEFIEQSAGYFGWFDAPLPSQAHVAFFVAFALLVIIAAVGTTRRGFLVMALLICLAIFVPALVQAYSVGQTGIIWQGRYALFLYIAIALVPGMLLSSQAGRRLHFLSVRMTVVVGALLAVFGIVAFVLTLRRYVVGNSMPMARMISEPQWQPPLTWPVLVGLMVVVWIAFAAWMLRQAVLAARVDPVDPVSQSHESSDPGRLTARKDDVQTENPPGATASLVTTHG